MEIVDRADVYSPLLVLTLCATIMSCNTSKPMDGDYRKLSDVLPSDEYAVSPSEYSSELYVKGRGNNLVFSSGIAGYELNGKWHDLDSPPIFRKGELYVRSSDTEKVRQALEASSSTEKRSKKEGKPFIVVIDPGHGGKYVGARGINGALEKDLNLLVAQNVKRYLDDEQIDVLLTRNTDSEFSSSHKTDLDRRVQFAARKNADLFISIHANAARSNAASGFEVYVSPPEDRDATIQRLRDWHRTPSGTNTANSSGYSSYQTMYTDHRKKSQRLARLIRDEFKHALTTESRGVKEKSLHVLRNAPCPAVLVELGFMTNPEEADLLSRSSYQQKLAKNIAQAIQSFQGSLAHYEGK